MGEAAGKRICLASLKNQPSNVLEGSFSKGFGDAEGSTSPNLDLQLGISNIYFSKARVATPGSSSVNFNQTHEGQASKLDLDLNLATTQMEDAFQKKTQMQDPKRLKKMMSNRVSSRNYRNRKMLHTMHLEKQTCALQMQISNICMQIKETKIEHKSLLVEQHQLKLKIAASEKERVVKEVEIGKNMAEVKRLRELQSNQLQAKQDAMRNSDEGLHEVNAQLDLNNMLGTNVHRY